MRSRKWTKKFNDEFMAPLQRVIFTFEKAEADEEAYHTKSIYFLTMTFARMEKNAMKFVEYASRSWVEVKGNIV